MGLAMHLEKLMKNKRLSIHLILGLTLVALIVWTIATTVTWYAVKKEVNYVFDAQQILFAKRLASSDLKKILLNDVDDCCPGGFRNIYDDIDEDALAFAIFSADGKKLLTDGHKGDQFVFDKFSKEKHQAGFRQEKIYNTKNQWKIYWLPVWRGELIIAVGQDLQYRNDLIRKMVFTQSSIWVASLPFLLLVSFLVFYQILKPIRQLSQNVQNRRAGDVSLLTTQNVPTEILPLVKNLNQFFASTSERLERERRFVSDAAHELRSPLTALRIQAEVAQLASDDATTRNEALSNLTQGIDRATQLIDQLLTLSRVDSIKELDNLEEINFPKIITDVISELYLPAQEKNIHLEFINQGEPKAKLAQAVLLKQLLKNLLNNAIKYCPKGSKVTVILKTDAILVEDNGNGVLPEDLNKLGQRFYRPAGQNEKGSGLGISIVAKIAELHHYQFHLENIEQNGKVQGLRAVLNIHS